MDNHDVTDELAQLPAAEAEEEGLCGWTCNWTTNQTVAAE